jgi:regulator of sigma E protease
MSISLPGDLNLLGMIKADPAFVRPLIPAEVDSVLPGSPAQKMGLLKGDRIIALNDAPVDSYNEFVDLLSHRADMMAVATTLADSLKARTVTIVYERNITAEAQSNHKLQTSNFKLQTSQDTADVVLTADLKLGFVVKSMAGMYKPVTKEYGFFESFPAGIKYGWNVLASYVDDLKYVFSAEGAKSLGGFGAIGNLFPASWDWHIFWQMTAFLSIILAFMNILPIPALDGGHVLFLLYEIITRRKPSEDFMIKAEYVGFGLLILLLIVANLNDVLRVLGVL